MACKYWYNGTLHTEEQFKSILNNGLIDQLIRDGKVELENIAPDADLIKNESSEVKIPYQLRILRRIQQGKNLNIGKKSSSLSVNAASFEKFNIIKVLTAASSGTYNNPNNFKIVIKVDGKLEVGKGKSNIALQKNIPESTVKNLTEGIPYLIVDSVYGPYPVRLYSNKIKDTKYVNSINEDIKTLTTSSKKEDIKNAKINLQEKFYRTSFNFNSKTGTLTVTQQTDEDLLKYAFTKNSNSEYINKEGQSIKDFLGEQIARTHYEKINSKDYNKKLSDNNVLVTDLFADKGNFFHSTNMVLESFSGNNTKVIDSLIPGKDGNGATTVTAIKTAKTSEQSNEKNTSTSTKEEETLAGKKIFNQPIKKSTPEKVEKDPTVSIKNEKGVAQVYTIREGSKIYNKNGKQVFADSNGKTKSTKLTRKIFANLAIQENRAEVVAYQEKKYIVNNKDQILDIESVEIVNDKLEEADKVAIISLTKENQKKIADEAVKEEVDATDLNALISKSKEKNSGTTSSEGLLGSSSKGGDFLDPNDPSITVQSYSTNTSIGTEAPIQWNEEQETEYMKMVMGKAFKQQSGKKGTFRVFDKFETLQYYLSAEDYKMLLEARKNGNELWGLFTKAAVLIQKNAPAGVTFHEAFHIVFNLALPLEQRIKLLNEAYTRYPELDAMADKLGRDLTWIEIEEFLAEKFREVTTANMPILKNTSKDSKKTEQNIPSFFTSLDKILKLFFAEKRALNIDNLFENINLGVYSNSIKFKNTVLDSSIRQMSKASVRETAPHKQYEDKLTELTAFKLLRGEMLSIVDAYKAQQKLNKNTTASQVISEIGVHRLIGQVLTKVIEDFNEVSTRAKTNAAYKPVAAAYDQLIDIFTNGHQGIKKSDGTINKIKRKGVEGIEFTNSTDFLEKFLRFLSQKNNLKIKYNIVSTAREVSAEKSTKVEEGETTNDRVAMQNSIEINPKESLSQNLKIFLETIPLSAGKHANIFAKQQTYEGNKVYGNLIGKISNSYSMETMLAKLEKINKPYSNYILQEIIKNPSLGIDLWAAMGQKNSAKFTAIYVVNGEYRVFNSNRKTVKDIIQQDLISNFVTPENPIFRKQQGKAWSKNINQEKARGLLIRIGKMQNAVSKQSNAIDNRSEETKKTRKNIFTGFSKDLKTFHLEITPEMLEGIYDKSQENFEQFLNILQKIGERLTSTSIDSAYRDQSGKLQINLKENSLGVTNPFLVLEPTPAETNKVDQKDQKNQKSLLESLAIKLEPVMENQVIAAFINMEGKTNYNLINSGQINKEIEKIKDPEKLKEFLSTINNDVFIKNLPFVQDLLEEDSDFASNLEVTILDGLSKKGKNKVVTYSKMGDIELEETNMAMFFNQSLKEDGDAWYKMPIPADSPNISYIKGVKLSNDQIIDKLTKHAHGELLRIQKVKQLLLEEPNNDLLKVKNYAENGTKFISLPFLNGKIDTSKEFNFDEVKKVIEDYFNPELTIEKGSGANFTIKNEGFFKNELEFYKKLGIIKTINSQGNIIFKENILDTRILKEANKSNSENTLTPTDWYKNYLMNQFYMNTQTTTFFGEDPAFLKSSNIIGDFQKRFKKSSTPGTYTVGEGFYNGIILADEFAPTPEETIKHVNTIINNSNLTDNNKKLLRLQWKNKTHNITDGGTYIHPERRRKILKDLNRWTDAHDTAYENMLKGNDTIEDHLIMNPPGNTEKPVYVGDHIVNGVRIPLYIKNSETVLTKSFALKKGADGKLAYPKLAAIYNDLEAGKYDTAIFESAVKLGGIGNNVVQNKKGEYKVSFPKYEKVGEKFVLPENVQILTLKESDYRLQQETIPHFRDDKSNFTTQLRNLIIADLNPSNEKTYNIDGKNYSGNEVSTLYQKLIVEDLKKAYSEIEDKFLTKEGALDYDTLLPLLREAAESKEVSQSYLDAIAPAVKNLADGTILEVSPTVLPLFHPKIAQQTEALLNSIFRNKITKQKIKGGQLVNTPSYGVSQDLKMEVDEKTGTITLEAIMPWTSAQFMPTDKKGNVDIDFIREHAPELLELVANRVPTEDKYSMLNIRIVGFSPPSSQGSIILPAEITTLTGLDFDIDKLFFMQKAYKVNDKGIPQIVKYIGELSDNKSDSISFAENIYRDKFSFMNFISQFDIGSKDILIKQYEENQANYIERIDKETKEDIKKLRAVGTPQALEAINTFYSEGGNKIDPISRIDYSEEDFKLVQSMSNALYKKVKLGEKIDFISLNSKEASDNKKISTIQSILRNEYTAPAILEGGNFDSWKHASARVQLKQAGKFKEAKLTGKALLEAQESLNNNDFFYSSLPSTQSKLFRRNMDGADLIGIFANHNVHHAKALHTNLKLRDPITINGIEYQSLSDAIINNVRISRLLATDVAAVVDNASEPLAGFLNINTFTANSFALMQRLGVEEEFIFNLMNQPIILQLSKNYFDTKGIDSVAKNIKSIRNSTKKLLIARANVEGIDASKPSKIELTTDLLSKNLEKSSKELSYEYLQGQLAALDLFEKVQNIGEELGEGIQAAKVDTRGLESNNATNFVTLQTQQKILENSDRSSIVGLGNIFSDYDNYTSQKMIPAFNTFGILKPTKIIGKIYDTIGQYDEKTGEFIFSNLGNLKLEIADHIKNDGILSEKEVKLIDINIINYLATTFPFFKYSENTSIITNVPKRLGEIKRDLKNPNSKLSKELSSEEVDNRASFLHFINEFSLVNKDKNVEVDRLEYYTTGKGPAEFELSENIWEKMLTSSNETILEFARDLVKYSFFSNGYGFGPYSFSNLIPVNFWSDSYQETIPENDGDTFNSFIARELQSIKDNGFPNKERFEEQFVKNYGTRQGLLKTVSEEKGSISVDKEGKLYVNKSKNIQLLNGTKFLKYLKRFNKQGDPILYKYVGDSVHLGINNKKQIIGEYIPIKELGIPNVLLAFNRNDAIGIEGSPVRKIAIEGNQSQNSIQEIISSSIKTDSKTKTDPEVKMEVDGKTITLNEQQENAVDKITNFILGGYKEGNQTFALRGYAGTGKTTILDKIRDDIRDKSPYSLIMNSSPTHRANAVMKLKGARDVFTLHSLLGLQPQMNLAEFDSKDATFKIANEPKLVPGSTLIIDESSMVNDQLYDYIMKLSEEARVQVIFVGDPGQIKPVKQKTLSKAFTEVDDIADLTTVERTGDNPLLKESTQLRTNKKDFSYITEINKEGEGIKFTDSVKDFMTDAQKLFESNEFKTNPLLIRMLAGTNSVVNTLNNTIRKGLWKKDSEKEYNDGEIMMGYSNWKVDYRTKEATIYNGGDYQIIKNTPTTKNIEEAGIEVPGYDLVIKNLLKPDSPNIYAFMISKTTPKEKLEKLGETFEKLRLEAMQLRGKAAAQAWVRLTEFKDTFMSPVEISYKGKSKMSPTMKYGYAHTIHKSQGGTYAYSYVAGDSINSFKDSELQNQLRYVAVSRAEKQAVIFTNKKISSTQSAAEVDITSPKNVFSVQPIKGRPDKKATIKSKIATQYIGFAEGITGSSTGSYAQQAGQYANTGNYGSNDVIFVSIGGKRGSAELQKSQQDRTITEAIKAVEAGATILTDNKAYTDSSTYNTGEKRLYKNMEAKGYNYSEVTVDGEIIGTWSKATQPGSEGKKGKINILASGTQSGRPNPNAVKIAYTDAIGKSSGTTKEQWDSWSVAKQNKHIECP